MVNTTLDNAISKLKKLHEPKPQPKLPDPILKQGRVLDMFWDKLVGYVSDVTALVLKNNYDTTVKNFPKVQKVEITNAKDLIEPKDDTGSRIITSLEALQRTIKDKPVLSIPTIQKVEVTNPSKVEKVVFPDIQKVEITNKEKPEKLEFPKKMQVEVLNTQEITKSIDTMCSEMMKMDKGMKKEKPTPVSTELMPLFNDMTRRIVDAVEQNKVTEVAVSNTGAFPVTFPIPTFKDANGQTTQVKLTASGYVPTVNHDSDGEVANIEDRKQTPTGKAMNVQIGPGDVISNIPVVIDYDHHQLHEGGMFRWSVYVSSLASGSNKDIRLVVPNITIPAGLNPACVTPHFRFEVVCSGDANAYLYESPTFTGNGSQRNPVAMERNGIYTPKLQPWEDPTTSVVGTMLWQGLLLATKSNAGDTTKSQDEFVLKNNTSYLFRVTSAANGNKVLMRMVWYEDLGV